MSFRLWETWSDALDLPAGPSRDAADYLYRNLIYGVRIMSQFEAFDDVANLRHYYDRTVRMARRAKELGCKVMLVADWHNANGHLPHVYHHHRYFSPDMVSAVAQMLEDTEPDVLEVANEPSYIRPGLRDMTAEEYADLVQKYIRAMERVGWRGLLIASPSRYFGFHARDTDERPDYTFLEEVELERRWEDEVSYRPVAEGQHSFILHSRPADMNEYYADIVAANTGRRPGIGYRFPIFDTEHSSVGETYDIDTPAGAEAVRTAWRAYRDTGVPYTWLTLGGTDRGGPRLRTWLVDGDGNYSLGAEELMNLFGVEIPPRRKGVKGTSAAYNTIRRAMAIGDARQAHTDRKFQKYLKAWRRAWKRGS